MSNVATKAKKPNLSVKSVLNWILDHAMIIVIVLLALYVQTQRDAFLKPASLINIISLTAARLRDLGRPFGTEASIAKLVATDRAMQVTTDAVQVLGGYGYTRDFPVERFMREAKVMQIFEGTNQIQRMVIGRALAAGRPASIESVEE